jgi:hypothetical protein
MAEQSVRHILMVTAVLQCASETLRGGGDASEAAARCLEMFGRLFPDATRDELRSAVIDAERTKKECKPLARLDVSFDQQIKPQTSVALSMRSPPQTFGRNISIAVGWRPKLFAPMAFVRGLRQFSRRLFRRRPPFGRPLLASAGTAGRGLLLPPN